MQAVGDELGEVRAALHQRSFAARQGAFKRAVFHFDAHWTGVPDVAHHEDGGPGSAAPAPGPDDPSDPTDLSSGGTPPLEDPTTGEPPTGPALG